MREEEREALEEQPQSEEERRLVQRARSLFDSFFSQSLARLERFRKYRDIRELQDDELTNMTAPRLNVLNSTIDTIIADQMDNPLEAVMIAERTEVEESAGMITDVIRFCLDQCAWDEQYAEILEDVSVLGTGFAEIFWDKDADGGRGLVSAQHVCAENIFPDPAYTKIQDGRAVFKTTWTTEDWVREHFPDCAGYEFQDQYASRLDGQRFRQGTDGDEPVMILEYWYKKYDGESRRYEVHKAMLCGGVLLYWSEQDEDKQDGVYGHAQYPFAVFTYRRNRRSIFGKGLMDDYADEWRSICRYSKYIDDHSRVTSKPRYLYKEGTPMDKIADYEQDFIPVPSLSETVMRQIEMPPASSTTFTYLQFLIESIKQDSGQNQFTRGEGGMGVTAASAIQALQEAGGKTARMHTASYKETFRKMVEQMIWVLSDYIDAERVMLVTGRDEFGDVSQSARQTQLSPAGVREKGRIKPPPYNVRIQVQRKNPMQIQANNQYVLQIAEVCGQAGQPLQPTAVLRLLQGIDNKGAILREVTANEQACAQLGQMAAQIEQLSAQLEQAQKQGMLQKQVITRQHQELAAQRAPAQTNEVSYGMLDTTNGVNRAEL